MQFSKGNEKLGSGCLGEEAKTEEEKILEAYPEIGILNQHNPIMLLPENAGWKRVYYVHSRDGYRDYFENTDLLALVETIRNWSKR